MSRDPSPATQIKAARRELRDIKKEAETLRDRLAAELSAARADAERYRWLRAEHERIDPCIRACAKYKLDRQSSDWVEIADLDSAIDAARATDSARRALDDLHQMDHEDASGGDTPHVEGGNNDP